MGLATVAVLVGGTSGTQDAAANGDTRTLSFFHVHTKEAASVTFRRNGSYDSQALSQLNWLLRDWRSDANTKMDPRLFDIIWEVHRSVGSSEAVHINSAYRSPETNGMLRRRSRAVSKHSQHMNGRAMDFYLPDVDMARVRAVAMRLQHGGVGYYPSSYNAFVHLDSGSVRSWPRMSRDQLVRLFPNEKTVHLPTDNKPLSGYEEAKAEILSRGGSVVGYAALEGEGSTGPRKSLWAMLFGGGDDEDNNPLGIVGVLVAIIVAPLAAMILQLAVSRQREYLADATAAQYLGEGRSLAEALATLERGVDAVPMNVNPATESLYIANPLRSKGMSALFSTHPPMAERIRRLRELDAAHGIHY